MSSEIGEYKGHPTITLRDDADEKAFVTFGVRKAKLILAHWDEIQRFVQGGEKPRNEQGRPDF